MDDQKRRISAIVQNRLHPEKFKQHGVIQNGVLLYGPRGTGKTFLAEATAGEFKINYWYAKPTSLIERWIGGSEANVRDMFARAYAQRPVLFFMDEIDSIGTQRQQLGRNDDAGGGAKLYNSVVTELMQCIDQYRGAAGFILMAATNLYDGLDEALVRDMRFDEKIRVDLPDEATRAQILTAQLSKRLWVPFATEPVANRTQGWSAAKLTGLVDKAASIWNATRGGRAYTGTGLLYCLRPLLRECGIRTLKGQPPRIHDLRHSFAVNALMRWYRDGVDVESKLPLLATYLGHGSALSTHHYLHFIEPIRTAASERFALHYGALVTPSPARKGRRR
jgi:ATP-dependent Zn protease